MRSKIAKQIIDETPEEVRIFVKKYGDIVVRVHQLLREKGWTQKDLAKSMEKMPSEISKWLSGDHNFTLRSLAKLEAELGAEIISVPRKNSFYVQRSVTFTRAVAKAQPVPERIAFIEAKKISGGASEPFAA